MVLSDRIPSSRAGSISLPSHLPLPSSSATRSVEDVVKSAGAEEKKGGGA